MERKRVFLGIKKIANGARRVCDVKVFEELGLFLSVFSPFQVNIITFLSGGSTWLFIG